MRNSENSEKTRTNADRIRELPNEVLAQIIRQCRCDKAVVIAIENLDGTAPGIVSVASKRDRNFIYTVGETVSVPDFCEDRFQECAAGIHFFINRQEAVEYSC